jgi:hypothetical protein
MANEYSEVFGLSGTSLSKVLPTVWVPSASVDRTDATLTQSSLYIHTLAARGARSGPIAISGRSKSAAYHT